MEFKKTYAVRYKDLRACLLMTANKDVRKYLCGVYVGQGMVAGCNGRMALICEEPDLKDLELVIPKSSIISLAKKLGQRDSIEYVQLHQIDEQFWLLQHENNYELFEPIEGKYPNIRGVDIPKPEKYTAEAFPVFNLDYLLAFRQAAAVYLRVLTPKLYPTTTNGSMYIEINERIHGILLPMRSGE
ncbi:hypothetical protein [Acinetobacter sp. ANC 3813]|uniref:hypothetical protein n=1 Tax=Acinetobacter sp. ANC 3813 TaxID=1977873 RepID=UPI000A32FB3C|nr:hypothetical protein [Acinetobacter sp. ANC 3813]OTG87835.1 hypothetical protein B9T34_15990 [Acinetobacter sp. ANC 3813]